jgi:hypothetical protein
MAQIKKRMSVKKRTPATAERVRFDPDLGITEPRLEEPFYRTPRAPAAVRRGRGEAVPLRNGGFESGALSPWRDVSWEPRGGRETFVVYPNGAEGVMTRASYRFHHDPHYFEWGTTGFRVARDG